MNIRLIYSIISVSVAFFIVFTSWFVIPEVVQQMIDEECTLTNGTSSYRALEKPENSIVQTLKVYFFNVTNPEEVQNGMKPILEEIGPYVYDMVLSHSFDDTSGTDSGNIVKYSRRKLYYFKEKESVGKDTDRITMLNVLFMEIVSVINKIQPDLIPDIVEILPRLFENFNDIFMRETISNILFDGIKLSCEDIKSEMLCSTVETFKMRNLRKTKDGNSLLISLLANGTVEGPFEIYTGKNDMLDRGLLVKYNESSQLNIWKDSCNLVKGSDGFFFSRPIEKNKGVDIFIPEFCKHQHFAFSEKQSTIDGISTYKFSREFPNASMENCYCVKENMGNSTDTKCPPKGVIKMTPCYGYSILLSMPHFYLGDPELLNNVKGIRPNKVMHESNVFINPITSVPLEINIRLQYNMELKRYENIEYLANVTEIIFPLVWCEINNQAQDIFKKIIKRGEFLNSIAQVVRWMLSFMGICLFSTFIAICIYCQFYSKEINGKYSPKLKKKTTEIFQIGQIQEDKTKL